MAGFKFIADDKGVWAKSPDREKLCVCASRIEIIGTTRDVESQNWGPLLGITDADGVVHEWSMPTDVLAGDERELRATVLNLGAKPQPGAKARRLLEQYLSATPDKRVRCVANLGWHGEQFVVPDDGIGPDGAERVYLQSVQRYNRIRSSRHTVAKWRDRIGRYCQDNRRLLLGVSVAFGAALLPPLEGEGGGGHFVENSSLGKSTLLAVAGSVRGGGGQQGYLRSWEPAINGLESTAEEDNDALPCLDEMKQCPRNRPRGKLPVGQRDRQSPAGWFACAAGMAAGVPFVGGNHAGGLRSANRRAGVCGTGSARHQPARLSAKGLQRV